jgi:hypothetical protein
VTAKVFHFMFDLLIAEAGLAAIWGKPKSVFAPLRRF